MTDLFILQEVLTDDVPFRVHNVKIDKFICEQDLPLMLLAHHDRLSDELKTQKPLTEFFGRINDKVTTAQACAIFGVSSDSLRPATHIKITGTTVIVWDDFPLALPPKTAKSPMRLTLFKRLPMRLTTSYCQVMSMSCTKIPQRH